MKYLQFLAFILLLSAQAKSQTDVYSCEGNCVQVIENTQENILQVLINSDQFILAKIILLDDNNRVIFFKEVQLFVGINNVDVDYQLILGLTTYTLNIDALNINELINR